MAERETTPTSASEVTLIGRLGSRTDERELPSGVVLTTFSIVIDRPLKERHGRTSVDTIACVATQASVSGRAAAWDPGTWVTAEGVLRRRFWRAGQGLGSAMEVEVRRLRKVAA